MFFGALWNPVKPKSDIVRVWRAVRIVAGESVAENIHSDEHITCSGWHGPLEDYFSLRTVFVQDTQPKQSARRFQCVLQVRGPCVFHHHAIIILQHPRTNLKTILFLPRASNSLNFEWLAVQITPIPGKATDPPLQTSRSCCEPPTQPGRTRHAT